MDEPGKEESFLLVAEELIIILEGCVELVVTLKIGNNATPTAGDRCVNGRGGAGRGGGEETEAA